MTESQYPQEVYVALYDKRIYLLTAQAQADNEIIRTGFADILQNISFD